VRRVWFRLTMLLLAVLLGSEIAHAVAARFYAGDGVAGKCAVFVLGYPANDDGTASAIEVQRVEAGVRALEAHQCGRLIVSGGAAHNRIVEADVMAAVAVRLGVARERLITERQARDTKENVALLLPLLTPGENVFIVSNALHAQRGRRYFCAIRPVDCARAYVVATAHAWWGAPQRLAESLHEAVAFVRDSIG
jgi:uncharacterized SAM-binding protein YcdF (DUF218 family)